MRFLRRLEGVLVGKRGIRDRRRWIAPAVVAVGSALVIWLVLPGVPWYFKAPLVALVFLYMGAQSAAYLARDDDDDPGHS